MASSSFNNALFNSKLQGWADFSCHIIFYPLVILTELHVIHSLLYPVSWHNPKPLVYSILLMQVLGFVSPWINFMVDIFLRVYYKVKRFKYLDSSVTNQNSIQEGKNVDVKRKIHVIIQSKHFCLLDFSMRLISIMISNEVVN